MLFKESLAMRRALTVFAIACFGCGILIAIANLAGHDTNVLGMHLASTLVFQACFFSAIFGVVYSTGLGSEASTTARVSLLFPQARWKTAMELLLVDLVAVIVSVPLGLLAFYLPMLLVYGIHHIDWGAAPSAAQWALPVALALAFYGLTCAIMLRMRASPQVGSLIFIASVVLYALSNARWPLRQMFRIIDWFNPLAYWMSAFNAVTGQTQTCTYCANGFSGQVGPVMDIGILVALCIGGLLLALLQWQHLQIAE
ncbi:MAG TPA: hypothetical protein VIJ12_09525 [Candidatus Baltobacteraceae bacterium]